MNERNRRKPSGNRPKANGLIAVPLPIEEIAAVETRVEIEGTDKAKWVRRLIRAELKRKPRT